MYSNSSSLETKKRAKYRSEQEKQYEALKILIEEGNVNRDYFTGSMRMSYKDMKKLMVRLAEIGCIEEKMVETRIAGIERMGYSVTEKGRELYRYLSEMFEMLLKE